MTVSADPADTIVSLHTGRTSTGHLPAEHRAYPWIALLAAVILICRLAPNVTTFSHTIDEPANIAGAVALWQKHKLTLCAEHPPVARLLPGLVLYLSGARVPPPNDTGTIRSVSETYDAALPVLFHGAADYWTLLRRARLVMLVFPLLSLLYLYRLTRYLAHSREAMLATLLLSVDPTFLGHAFWVNTDAAGCAGYLIGSYYGLRFLFSPSRGRALAGGAALAFAIGAKASGLLLLPALGAILVLHSAGELRGPEPWRRRLGNWIRRFPSPVLLMLFAAAAFFTLWAFYFFNIDPMADQTLLATQRRWLALPAWIKQTPIPMPSFFLGIFFQIAHNHLGHYSFLNGQVSQTGWWYYFPEAFVLKMPLAVLAGLLVSLIFLGAAWWAGRWPRRIARVWVFVFPAILLAAAMGTRIDIGIRYILPAIPFVYLFLALVLGRGRRAILIIALLSVAALETAAIHPDYLSFFNCAVGGPQAGQRYLADSNLDWGQDVARLAGWLRAQPNHGRPYSLRLFTTFSTEELERFGLDPEARTRPPQGLFAISIVYKLRIFRSGPDYSWLQHYPLVQRIGHSIEVYDVGDHPAVPPDEVGIKR